MLARSNADVPPLNRNPFWRSFRWVFLWGAGSREVRRAAAVGAGCGTKRRRRGAPVGSRAPSTRRCDPVFSMRPRCSRSLVGALGSRRARLSAVCAAAAKGSAAAEHRFGRLSGVAIGHGPPGAVERCCHPPAARALWQAGQELRRCCSEHHRRAGERALAAACPQLLAAAAGSGARTRDSNGHGPWRCA